MSEALLFPRFFHDPYNDDNDKSYEEKSPPHAGFENCFYGATTREYKKGKEQKKQKGCYFHELIFNNVKIQLLYHFVFLVQQGKKATQPK